MAPYQFPPRLATCLHTRGGDADDTRDNTDKVLIKSHYNPMGELLMTY